MTLNLSNSDIEFTQTLLISAFAEAAIKKAKKKLRRYRVQSRKVSCMAIPAQTRNPRIDLNADGERQHQIAQCLFPKKPIQIIVSKKSIWSSRWKRKVRMRTSIVERWVFDATHKTLWPGSGRGEVLPNQQSEPESSDSDEYDELYVSEAEDDWEVDEKLEEWNTTTDPGIFYDAFEVESDVEEDPREMSRLKPPLKAASKENKVQWGYWDYAKEIFSMLGDATQYVL